jgi:uncharacterized membrane protein
MRLTAAMLRTILQLIITCGFLLYPIVMYWGLQHYSPRLIAVLLGMGVTYNLLHLQSARHQLRLLFPVLGTLTLCVLSALLNQSSALLYLPFLISMNLGLSFGYSLLYPPSMVEVFAKMSTSDLSEETIRYCRLITLIWVVFFVCNATIASLTACCADLEVWSLYNGFIAYCAIGLLFTAELCYRYWRFRRYVGLPTDAFFKRIFPPKE